MQTAVASLPEMLMGDGTIVGKVTVSVELINVIDENLQRMSKLTKGEIRNASIEAIVDTGSTMLVLPEDVIQALGVHSSRQVTSVFANGQKLVRKVYDSIRIRVMDRDCVVEAISVPEGRPALLGQLPLEAMDFLVDPKRQKLIPNDPEMPIYTM